MAPSLARLVAQDLLPSLNTPNGDRMKTYANVENGILIEIIAPREDEHGNEIPIGERYHPQFVAGLIDITDVTPQPICGMPYPNDAPA